MKFKDIFPFLGFKKPVQRYGYTLSHHDIAGAGQCVCAQWLHPAAEKRDLINQLDGYRELIKPGDFCLDIGAFAGDTTLPMAIAAGKTGAVLAFEPNPYVFHVLGKNARANRKICNIIPLLAAVSDRDSYLEMEYSDPGYFNGGRHENISALTHGHAYKLKVYAVNLASELRTDFADLLPRLSFIKVDCEGYDLFILKSIREIIKEFKPAVKCEIFKHTSRIYRRDLLKFFKKLNYSVRRIVRDPFELGEELRAESCENWKNFDVLCQPLV